MAEQLEGIDQEIVNRLNTAYRKVLVVGKEVFVPPIYSHRERPYVFHVKQLRFLYYLSQNNGNVPKACELAGCSSKFAMRFLRSHDYRQFAAEAIEDQAIQDGWNARRVVVEYDQIYKGKKRVNETQLEALKELKTIVIPKTRDSAPAGPGLTLNLNFPVLPPDVQQELKNLADKAASIDVDAA